MRFNVPCAKDVPETGGAVAVADGGGETSVFAGRLAGEGFSGPTVPTALVRHEVEVENFEKEV